MEGLGGLLAALLPVELRGDDRARAAMVALGQGLDALIKIGAKAGA